MTKLQKSVPACKQACAVVPFATGCQRVETVGLPRVGRPAGRLGRAACQRCDGVFFKFPTTTRSARPRFGSDTSIQAPWRKTYWQRHLRHEIRCGSFRRQAQIQAPQGDTGGARSCGLSAADSFVVGSAIANPTRKAGYWRHEPAGRICGEAAGAGATNRGKPLPQPRHRSGQT
jgi:hypothetical protein